MRYISEDNKVFNTEQECCEHEEKLRQNRIKNEQLEVIRQDRINAINKKYKELQDLVSEYERDYGVRHKPYFVPFYEIFNMLSR